MWRLWRVSRISMDSSFWRNVTSAARSTCRCCNSWAPQNQAITSVGTLALSPVLTRFQLFSTFQHHRRHLSPRPPPALFTLVLFILAASSSVLGANDKSQSLSVAVRLDIQPLSSSRRTAAAPGGSPAKHARCTAPAMRGAILPAAFAHFLRSDRPLRTLTHARKEKRRILCVMCCPR